MNLDAWLTIGGVCSFSLVWLGLARNIRSIARRDSNPPSFHPVLNAAHMGRFAGWALVGAATLSTDIWTGVLLLTTRVPAVVLVAVTFLQRRENRPALATLVRTLVPLFALLVAGCVAVALWQPRLPVLGAQDGASALSATWGLPPATALHYALNAFVIACFAVQVLYALPRQIAVAWTKPLGNLRWFQLGLLSNYAYTLLYTTRVEDPLVEKVMATAYAAVFVQQVALVVLIERGVRRARRERAD